MSRPRIACYNWFEGNMEGVPRRNASQFTFKIGNGLSIKREDLQNYDPFKGVTDSKARTTSSADTHQC